MYTSWGYLSFPIPPYISTITIFNFKESFLTITIECLILILLLLPFDLFKKQKRRITCCLALYYFVNHICGIFFYDLACLVGLFTAITAFFIIQVYDIILNTYMIVCSYILTYLIVILYAVSTIRTTLIIAVLTAIASLGLTIFEVSYRCQKKSFKDVKSHYKKDNLQVSLLTFKSLCTAFALSILLCNISIYDFFTNAHNSKISDFARLSLNIFVMLGWIILIIYYGLVLRESD